jgi:hypothetical protein
MLLSPCGQLDMAPSAGEQVLVVPELYGTITDRAESKKHQAAGWCTTNPTAQRVLTVTFLGASPGPWSGVSPSRLSPGGARRLSATAVTVLATTESPGEIPRSRHRPASGKVTNEAAGIAGVAPARDRVGRRERKRPRPTAVP